MTQSLRPAQSPLLLGQWCAELETRDGVRLKLRPANPDDEALLAAFFGEMLPEDVRFRFLTPVPHPGHDMLSRLVDVDHVRDENFLAFAGDGETLVATAMITADPSLEKAEVAIAVRSDHRNKGVGWTLLDFAAHYAEAKGFRTIESVEAHDNRAAIGLECEMGFSASFCPDDPRLVLVRKTLGAPETADHG
jgi:ribosomal protein S18 acetylase RimI-like enzyme